MRFFRVFILLILTPLIAPHFLQAADYAQEIRDQTADIKKNHPKLQADYFHDMGIVARKASDAGLNEMAAEIIRGLFASMNHFVEEDINNINRQFEEDAFQASRRVQELSRLDRYYQPPEDFMKSALGKALTGDAVQSRANALDSLGRGCSPESILLGAQAIKQTGLWQVNSSSEIESIRKLTAALNACFSWKTEIVFLREQEFETLYEKGILKEEAHLRLESSRSDLSQARWVGEWISLYTGRDGKGEGISQAILTYHRGEDAATLVISTARVTSTGRMNFPNNYSNDKRTIDVSGTPLYPKFDFFGQKLSTLGPEQKK